MKKIFNKITTGLATFGIAMVSFFSKVFGQDGKLGYQLMYGVEPIGGEEVKSTLIDTITKLAKRPLVGIAFIIGIISFIKIRKVEDKVQKKKKIKKAIIAISILLILIIACLILPRLLRKY